MGHLIFVAKDENFNRIFPNLCLHGLSLGKTHQFLLLRKFIGISKTNETSYERNSNLKMFSVRHIAFSAITMEDDVTGLPSCLNGENKNVCNRSQIARSVIIRLG